MSHAEDEGSKRGSEGTLIKRDEERERESRRERTTQSHTSRCVLLLCLVSSRPNREA